MSQATTQATLTGKFVWYELMTTDPKAAAEFYPKITGWGTMPWGEGPTPYTMWTVGQGPIGGLMELPEEAKQAGAPPHWMAYVAVEDVDAKAREAEAKGASLIVPPMDIPKVGRFAIIADPAGGATIALFRGEGEMPRPEGPPEVGEFSWNELAASDGSKAFEFYSSLFGWEKDHDFDMGPMGAYRIYRRPGGHPLGGMMTKPKEMPVCCWLHYIRVADLNAALEAVKAGGGQVIHGPMEVPGGDMIAQCLDPQGALFALHWRKTT